MILLAHLPSDDRDSWVPGEPPSTKKEWLRALFLVLGLIFCLVVGMCLAEYRD